MKISQIIQETTTTAGSVAPVEHGFVKMQTRNPGVYGGNKVGNLLKGKKTNKAFANSVNESAEISETELSEQDLIVVPGQGRSRKNGFVPHGQSRVDHEVEMARSDLIQASKNAEKVYNMIEQVSEDEGLDGWVQEKIIKANDYLNTVREYLEGKEVQGMNEGSQQVDSLVTDALKIMRGPELNDAVRALKTVLGNREYNGRRGYYNFYVKQLMDMHGQQGIDEAYEPGLSSKLIAAGTKVAEYIFITKGIRDRAFRTVLELEHSISDEELQSHHLYLLRPPNNMGQSKSTEMLKWMASKGSELNYDESNPIDFQITIPGSAAYSFNIVKVLRGTNESLDEGAEPAVDDKGWTQRDWIDAVKRKFPGAKIIQSKMIDGPCQVTLPNGKTLYWAPAKGATESLGTTGAMTNGEMGEGQLDELSPQALGSYVKSAAGDMANRKGNTQFQKGARVATSAFTSKQQPGRFEKDDKIEKRQDGINRAVNKITGKN